MFDRLRILSHLRRAAHLYGRMHLKARSRHMHEADAGGCMLVERSEAGGQRYVHAHLHHYPGAMKVRAEYSEFTVLNSRRVQTDSASEFT